MEVIGSIYNLTSAYSIRVSYHRAIKCFELDYL